MHNHPHASMAFVAERQNRFAAQAARDAAVRAARDARRDARRNEQRRAGPRRAAFRRSAVPG